MSKKSGRKFNPSDKGFTLVELLVVLVILAIIAAIAVPAMLGFTDSAKEKEYTAQADSALKATQSVLTDLYNNADNFLAHKKRYGAAEIANVDPNNTVFRVWTAKQLVSGATTAVSDNIGSYTVKYALYKVTRDEKAKCVFYNGKTWTVYDDEASLPQSVTSIIGDDLYSDNVINMWPDYSENEGSGEDYSDSASNETTPGKRNWVTGEEDDKTIETVTITLCGYNQNIDQPWLRFIAVNNSSIIKKEMKASFEIVKRNGILSEVNYKEWFNDNRIQNGSTTYSMDPVSGFSELCWSKDQNPTNKTKFYSNRDAIKTAVGKGFIKNNDTLYVWGKKDTNKITILLKAFNENTLSFGSDNANQVSVDLYNYSNEYDSGTFDSDINSELINALSEDNVKVHESCEQNGWAFGDGESFEKDGEDLKTYAGASAIWNKAFNGENIDLDSNAFYGNLVQNKKVILKPGKAKNEGDVEELPSYFNENAKEFYSVTYAEILNTFNVSDLDNYNKDVNKLQIKQGYRFDYWENSEASGEEFYTMKDISDFVQSDATSGRAEYEFTAVLKKRGTALLLSNENSVSLKSQITSMADYKKNLYCFDRIQDWDTFVGAVGTDISKIVQDVNTKQPVECGSAYGKTVNGTGNIYKVYVLYNGAIEGYPTPVYAYSQKISKDEYRAYWYCEDNVTLQEGSYSGCFENCERIDFTNADLNSWDVYDCTNMSAMFKMCYTRFSGLGLDLSAWDTRNVTNVSEMFAANKDYPCKYSYIDISNMYTENVTTMDSMFKYCTEVQLIKTNSRKFTASDKLNSVVGMYEECKSLRYLDLTGFKDCTNLQTINSWFKNCCKIKCIYLNNFSTSTKLNNIDAAFAHVGDFDGSDSVFTLDKVNDGCAVFAKGKWENSAKRHASDTKLYFDYCFRIFLYGTDTIYKDPKNGKGLVQGDPGHLDIGKNPVTDSDYDVDGSKDKRLRYGYFNSVNCDFYNDCLASYPLGY